MKQFLRIAEQIIVGLCIIALTFRLLDWPGGDMYLMIGLLSLSFFNLILSGCLLAKDADAYLPVTIHTDITTLARGISALSALSISIALVGILFRLLHWQGWQPQLIAGAVGCGVALIGVLFVVRQQETKLYQYLSNRLILILGISITLSLNSF